MKFQTIAVLAALLSANMSFAAQVTVSVKDRNGAPLPNVVASLLPIDKTAPAVSPNAVAGIAQQGFKFVPFVSVVQRGTKARFPNFDSKEHHVKVLTGPTNFEFKVFTAKEPAPVTLDALGKITVHCLLHGYMVAHIYVVDTPWFAKSAAAGSLSIDDVPEGDYEIKLEHPSLLSPSQISPALPKRITVSNKAATNIDIKFDLVAKPEPR